MKKILIFSAILVGTANLANAAESARFSGYGGSSFSNVRTEGPTPGDSRESSFAYGAALEAALLPDVGLEVGAVASEDRLQIPLLARFFGGRTFTLAAGAVADNVEKGKDDFRWALAAGPGLNFHLGRDVDIFVEGRVMRAFEDGLTDFGDNDTDFNALAGVRVALDY